MTSKDTMILETRPVDITPTQALKALEGQRQEEVDIAAQVIKDNAAEAGDEPWTSAEDKKLMKKVDWRIVPVVCML